jgi:hypothetical protein
MKKSALLLLLFSLGFIFQAAAQCKTVVYGNVGVSNVNISISNSSHGTSTDAWGQYALILHDCTKPVYLRYSCIGYQDTVVSLSSQQLQRDSVNISFRMRKQKYNLQEVTVTTKQKLYGNRYYFMDFEVFDNTICILAACPNKNRRCLILADEALQGHDTIPLPAHIKPERVMRDCMCNCQLIANDSVYEIDPKTQPHKLTAVEKSHYFRTMSDCLFATDTHVYFKEKGMQGYFTSFYRVDRETKKPQQLFLNDVTDNIRKYWDEMTFFMKYWSPTSHGAPPGVWSQYIKNQWFRTSDAELRLADDNLYYFDQSLGYIQHYDLNINKIDSCAIQYPFMEGWKHTLYQDIAQNRFYTFIKSQIYEINPTSGSIIAKAKLTPSLYPKIIIHDGQLFLLKKTHDSSGEGKTLIERRKL